MAAATRAKNASDAAKSAQKSRLASSSGRRSWASGCDTRRSSETSGQPWPNLLRPVDVPDGAQRRMPDIDELEDGGRDEHKHEHLPAPRPRPPYALTLGRTPVEQGPQAGEQQERGGGEYASHQRPAQREATHPQ